MDIYKRKSNFKLLLLIIALLIGIATVAYTNYLAGKIAKEEKRKAQLWAQAIGNKARLVKYTNDLFIELAADERKKMNTWAQSTQFMLKVNDNELLSFFSNIIRDNTDIPLLLTNDDGKILSHRNIRFEPNQDSLSLTGTLLQQFSMYPPVVIQYQNKKNFIYYKDSNLFSRLKNTLNDLIRSFISEVVINTASAPVILTDDTMRVLAYGQIDSGTINDKAKLLATIERMKSSNDPIPFDLGEGGTKYIYYDDSAILKQLKLFPLIQLGIFAAFLLIAYLAFSSSRNAEQNRVWVGLAKETAHQLGTPISSLSAWVDYLKESDFNAQNSSIVNEIEQDVERLTLVADRFSKIGSVPQLQPENVKKTMERNMEYMSRRASQKVQFNIHTEDPNLLFKINPSLFDWVLENLLKNALDAMDGEGEIDIEIASDAKYAIIDVSDTGKGISSSKFKTIFEPGYSTKRRGWGLGLSLTKRIVEQYHNGEIFVRKSVLTQGTTFRVLIPKG